MIHVQSVVDEKLKKIKDSTKERKKRTKKAMDSTLCSFFYSLKNVYYVILCTCVAPFSLFLRSHHYLLFAFSLVCYGKREIIPLSNVLPTTFTPFFGCPIAIQVSYQSFKNMRFHSTPNEGVAVILFEKKTYFSCLSSSTNFYSKNFDKTFRSFLHVFRFLIIYWQ